MSKLKIAGWVLLGALVVIQFFRPAKNEAAGPFENDISSAYPTSPEVQIILNKACADCHSNNTVYPWYAEVQPVAWWLSKHVKDGKRHLNFSEFLRYPAARQYHKLEEVTEMVEEGEMPLSSYTLAHRDARLSAAERKLIIDWSRAVRDSMKRRYPPDSLVQKKRK